MRDLVQVAVCQVRAHALDPEANATTTVATIERAARDGARLVILPELAASGYGVERTALLAVAESVANPGPVLQAWRSAARRLKVAIVGGLAEVDGDRLFNSAVTIDESGEIVSVYRKLHLFAGERDCFAPGDLGLPIVTVLGMRVGVIVCYDLRFPEAMRILALRGAELIAVPTAWVAGFDRRPPSGRIGQVDGAIVQANLNQVYVACADTVGAIDPFTFLGQSVVVSPYGQALAGPLSGTYEDIAHVTVDPAAVAAARHRGPGIDPFENRRADVYAADLGYREPVADQPVRPSETP